MACAPDPEWDGDSYQITYMSGDASPQRAPLVVAASAVRLEQAGPVRSFGSHRGQRNFPGLWWSATSGRHVGFESWLERDHTMLLDFDPAVVGFAAQPFRLSWLGTGRSRSHVPDFFARLDDGTGVVVDCRPEDRVGDADAEVFRSTERACAIVGWSYRLVHAPDEVVVSNVRWLAGYRHPRCYRPEVAERLAEVFARPTRLLAGAAEAGDPVGTLPVTYHLLWRGQLKVDLAVALDENSFVSVPGA